MSDSPPTWKMWLTHLHAFELFDFPNDVADQVWSPGEEDRSAAWALYTELRTRITTQPLHYLHGDEVAALTSVADLFKLSREIIRQSGPKARHFATLTVFAMNRVVRPFTAKWHKKKCDGALEQEDIRHELRGELTCLQRDLRLFATVLGALAENDKFVKGSESWPEEIGPRCCFAQATPLMTNTAGGDIPFDIAFDNSVARIQAAEICWYEHEEIRRRHDPILPPGDKTAAANAHYILPDPNSPQRLKNISGLAISGGGIRSATFALGVVQRLSEAGVLGKFDYLSTVSGGGYLGAFLSTYLNTDSGNHSDVGTGPNQLPFRKPAVGESGPLRHLRGHSKYLVRGGIVNTMNMALLAIYGVVSTALIFWPLLAGLLLIVAYYQGETIRNIVRDDQFNFAKFLGQPGILYSAIFGIAAPLLSLAPVSWFCRQFRKDDKGLLFYQRIVSGIIAAALLIVVWNLVPQAFRGVEFLNGKWGQWLPTTTAVTGAFAALQRFWTHFDVIPAASKVKKFIVYLLLALAGPTFGIVLFLLLGDAWIVHEPTIGNRTIDRIDLFLWLTFAPLFFAFLFLDVNQSSLHPFYRRKLSEAYLIAYNGQDEGADRVRRHDGTKLSELRSKNPKAPYHLINCALNAPSSDNPAVRGRGTDFFLFSQGFCGSPALGYFKTCEWEEKDSRLNLGTVMAASAAAASPIMGVASIPGGNFLLTLFNVRLDYWLATPKKTHRLPWVWRAGPWYLLRQAFGWMDERSWYVDVSDGGHIENLATYELLRRRCKFIVTIDGECDPSIRCGGLIRLTELAQIDFGVTISIDISRFTQKPDGTVPFHFALATIAYPRLNDKSPAATGYLLYIKLSRTGNEPPHVNYYHSRHSEFPHESTADQFFEEDQFESYRSLGYHAASDLFSRELLSENPQPASLSTWFEKISAALADPNKE